jgi:hypothetical protein
LPDDGFARERLGISPDPDAVATVIPSADWLACADPGSSPDGPPVFGFDATPDQAGWSIAAAGVRSDGQRHVEIIERGTSTSGAAAALQGLRARWPSSRIVADLSGPAGAASAEAKTLGVEVDPVATRDYTAACALIYKSAVERSFRHRTEPVLDAALAGAVRADVGDGAWKWSRKNSTVDISPLVAATLALHAAFELQPVSAGFVDLNDYLD